MRTNILVVHVLLIVALGFSASFGQQGKVSDCELARDYYKRGTQALNYEERRELFQKAVNLCPSFAEARVNLADALENIALIRSKFDQKNLEIVSTLQDKAIKQYQEALRLNDRLNVARWGLIDIYMVNGSYGLAREEYRKILSSEPHNEQARDGLANVSRLVSGLATKEKGALRTSSQIVGEAKNSAKMMGLKTMGFEDRTVKDRQSFNNILFGGWSSAISQGEPMDQLNEIGKALSSGDLSKYQFIIEGHTNNVGEENANLKLSWERAQSVKSYLEKNFAIDPSRILIQGFGFTRPKFPNDNEENKIRNRRVEIVFFTSQKATGSHE